MGRLSRAVWRAVILGAGLLTLGAGAHAADVTLRFSSAAPPSDFLAKAIETFKSEVENAKVGVKVEILSGLDFVQARHRGAGAPARQSRNEHDDHIRGGAADPGLGFFNRGYLFRDYDHMRHVIDGPIGEGYRHAVADKMGIAILATAYLGTRQVNLRQKRPVKGPADLAGVKLRMTAGPEWLLLGKALGVSPVPMGMPEVYLALKTGAIDGQENPLSILNAAKLYEVTEQVVLTSHMIQPVFFSMAKPVWDKLGPISRKS